MYSFQATRNFQKQLKKLDRTTANRILKYIDSELSNCEDPRILGKRLTGDLSEFWRYRIGNYRMIVKIVDEKFIIIGLSVEHRSKIYKRFKISKSLDDFNI